MVGSSWPSKHRRLTVSVAEVGRKETGGEGGGGRRKETGGKGGGGGGLVGALGCAFAWCFENTVSDCCFMPGRYSP